MIEILWILMMTCGATAALAPGEAVKLRLLSLKMLYPGHLQNKSQPLLMHSSNSVTKNNPVT